MIPKGITYMYVYLFIELNQNKWKMTESRMWKDITASSITREQLERIKKQRHQYKQCII